MGLTERIGIIEATLHPEGRCADCGGGKDYWKHHDKAKSEAPDDWHFFKSEKDVIIIGKESSIGDPEWGMYVTPDDPNRDTPEKARAYYTALFYRMGWAVETTAGPLGGASTADIDAAIAITGGQKP